MKRLVIIALFIAFCVVLFPAYIAVTTDVPYLTGRVNDNAHILSPETIRILTDSLRMHEMRTTDQVVILTLPTLDGESIEDFANNVFNTWKLGQKDKDNGVLIIVVPNDRKMRIEVGYGLEGTLPDLAASNIIQNIITPSFKNGDYNKGLTEGTLSVIKILEGGYVEQAYSEAEEQSVSTDSGLSGFESPDMPITERILIGAFIFGLIGLFTVIGILTPGFGWFLYIFLIPFWAMFPIIVLGTKGALVCLITYMLIYPSAKLILKRTDWYKKAKIDIATKGHASIGGFTYSSGGSGGSWSSGSSHSGGGGFSGGGGSSGGGGASGSW
jgi:uncharacterized protein